MLICAITSGRIKRKHSTFIWSAIVSLIGIINSIGMLVIKSVPGIIDRLVKIFPKGIYIEVSNWKWWYAYLKFHSFFLENYFDEEFINCKITQSNFRLLQVLCYVFSTSPYHWIIWQSQQKTKNAYLFKNMKSSLKVSLELILHSLRFQL